MTRHIKLHYTVTEQAYLDFSLYQIEQSDSVRRLIQRNRSLPAAIGLFVTFGSLVILHLRFGTIEPNASVFFLVLGVLWYFLYPAMYWNSVRKQLKAFAGEGSLQGQTTAFTLELQVDRLRVEGVGIITEVLYSRIETLLENKGHVYIGIGGMEAFIIPLDCFDSEAAYGEFRDCLEQKCREHERG